VKGALVASSLAAVVLAACGRHDTPLASYSAPSEAAAGGQAGAPADDLACPASYTTAVAGLTSRYREVTTGRRWALAERDCESDGGHLIVIDSEAENAFAASFAELAVTNVTSTHQLAWLGAGDSRTEGAFYWITGSALTLAFWTAAEPNSLFDDEDCVEIRANAEWNDDRCDAELAYVCECDGAVSAAEWCDTSLTTSCGDCITACPSPQACVKQQCQ
jgi:hypothetical protein